MEKPGWKTTEFLVVVVAAILSVAVGAGYLAPDQATEIEGAIASVINALTDLVTVLTPLIGTVAYVWSRTKVKVGK